MANSGKFEFEVGFNVRGEELVKAAQEIQSIKSMVAEDLTMAGDTRAFHDIENGLNKAKEAAGQLEKAFDASFNKDLGVLNIAKFEQEIAKTGKSISEIGNQLAGAGEIGSGAFRKMATSILTTNTYVKQTDELIAKIAKTLGNTLKWNISSSAINSMSGAIQEARGYTKALDTSLNYIQIVTNKSSEDMKEFAVRANDAAKALGTTTTNYTKAALTFYQQGLDDENVMARATVSNKVSNVTGLSGDQSAEYVTAVLNGYKVAAEDGKFYSVLGIYPQGLKQIYKITFSDKNVIECSGDHIWTWQSSENRNRHTDHWTNSTTEELSNKTLQLNNGHWDVYLPQPDVIDFPEETVPLNPYLLGALLGDGNMSDKGLVFTVAEDDLKEKIQNILAEYNCSLNYISRYDYSIKGPLGFGYHNVQNYIGASLRELGLTYHNSHNKFIPDIYK